MKKISYFKVVFKCILLVTLINQSVSANYNTDELTLTESEDTGIKMAEPAEPEPIPSKTYRFTHISDTSVDLGNIGTALCTTSITPDSSTAKLQIYMYLERNQGGTWTPYKSWSASKTGPYLSLSQNVSVAKGYTYRVKGSFYANGENHISYSRSVAF